MATLELDDEDDFLVDEDEICTNQDGELKTSKERAMHTRTLFDSVAAAH